ncbi:MAG: hypothetical protein LBD84_07495 [Campylobacteraceae bacterium]|nr:hypothetical protein [Campylobacteraceae bacterium]
MLIYDKLETNNKKQLLDIMIKIAYLIRKQQIIDSKLLKITHGTGKFIKP